MISKYTMLPRFQQGAASNQVEKMAIQQADRVRPIQQTGQKKKKTWKENPATDIGPVIGQMAVYGWGSWTLESSR